jgi:hypothetical protein
MEGSLAYFQFVGNLAELDVLAVEAVRAPLARLAVERRTVETIL